MNRFFPRLLGLAVLLVLPSSCLLAQAPSDGSTTAPLPVEQGLDPALARHLASHLGFLASDEMGGRETGTREGDITARYVASVFQGLGLEPAGEQGFLQTYPLSRTRLVEQGTRLVLAGEPDRSFVLGDDYVPRGADGGGYELSSGVVFVGYGLNDEQSGQDAYAGLDVEGRLVLALMGAPGEEQPGRGGSWRDKQELAREHKASGLLLAAVPGDRRSEMIMGFVRRSLHRASLQLGAPEESTEAPFPRVYLTTEAAGELFAEAGRELSAELESRAEQPWSPGFALDGVQLDLALHSEVDQLHAENAAGLLRGSDPELAREIVVLSAHMDHVGMADDGQVFNGADDNASGTSALMAVAEALLAEPEALRRSVLFLSVSGEEKGLLGSSWWVDHPTVSLADVVADINTDMVGRNDPHSLGVTPSPEHPAYNTLVRRAVELGPAAGLEVGFKAGEGEYERQVDVYYSRSDHKNFSDAGIPVAFFFAGEHEDYHQLGDTLDKIDLGKLGRVVRLVTALVKDVADAEQRPHALAEG